MIALSCREIALSYGTDVILNEITFSVNRGEKLGIVGVNGAGKSTLFSIICHEILPDRGSVYVDRNSQTELLRQQNDDAFGDMTVYEWALSRSAALYNMEIEMLELEKSLEFDHSEHTILRFTSLSEQFSRMNGHDYRNRVRENLFSFSFTPTQLEKKASELSGGEKNRSEERRVGKECRSRWSPYH